jgi:putative FmdB family regulatory protein
VPTYDYQCRSCERVIEVIHPMTADGPSVCEACGGALRRILYPTGIIFKGSGFYSTDSRSSTSSTSPGSSSKPSGSGSGASSGEGGGGTKASEGSSSSSSTSPTSSSAGDAS